MIFSLMAFVSNCPTRFFKSPSWLQVKLLSTYRCGPRSDPESFFSYFESWAAVQMQRLPLTFLIPHGHGFIAAIKVKSAGKRAEPFAREIAKAFSSSGSRSDSTTRLSNSGNSSRNKTPLWASVISPGRGMLPPPPTKAAYEEVWCGARNGGADK